MKTTKLDLITEINVMRGMMGLSEKNLITEQIATLINTFAKSSSKYIGKSADDIANLLSVPLAKARNLKTWFDDLDSAIKSTDDALIKRSLYNIFSNVDPSVVTKYVDDILIDTADDSLVSALTNRVKVLKAQGVMDDAIKTQLKKDIDDVLDGLPDTIKTALKNKVDNIFNSAIKGMPTPSKMIKSEDILKRLSMEQTWANFTSKFPELIPTFTKRIDDIIAGGAKSEDEVLSVILKQAKGKLNGTAYEKILGFKAKNPKIFKFLVYSTIFGGATLAAGEAGLLPKMGKTICELFIGKSDSWCVAMFSSAYEESGSVDGTTTNEECDKDLGDFTSWAEGQFGSGGDPSFDENTCTGTVFGDQYKWNGSEWV